MGKTKKRGNKMTNFQKGDRVCYRNQGDLLHGIVYKGGTKKIKVILDDGRCISGHPVAFYYSNEPLPKSKICALKKGNKLVK